MDEIAAAQSLDSKILAEQFYFFTVTIMWLIHAGFMAYEAGVARRKNVMSTAMKNILTIAVVTPAFYYFGWWIYGCFERGLIPTDPNSAYLVAGSYDLAAFCKSTYPWSDNMGPNLQDNITGVFWAAFLLFSWTTGSIMSGALIERVRLSAYLVLTTVLGSAVWIMDAAWGWAPGGWLVTEYGFHDAIASGVVHGVAGAFTLGVLLQLGPRIGKYDMQGRARSFMPHNLHMTLLGLMLIFTGFYAFYAACLVIQSTVFPGWANIYLSPATLSAITFSITIGFAGGFIGGYFASRGDPFWTLSGGLAGVIGVSAGADIYAPSLVFLLSCATAVIAVYAGKYIEFKLRIDDVVGAVAVHGCSGFLGMLWVGLFAAGYPTGLENVDSSLGGQLMGMLTFFPLGFLPGLASRLGAAQGQPPARAARGRLEGLDMAEFQADFFPEFERTDELVVMPDGTVVEAGPVLLESYRETIRR